MLPIFHHELSNLEAAERAEHNQEFRLQRRAIRDSSDPFNMPDDHFKELLRLTIPVVINLINMLRPYLPAPLHSTAVNLELKVLAMLRFYATGAYQRGVGQDFTFGMSQTSVHRAIHEVTNCIDNHIANNFIQFPQTRQERDELKVQFLNNWGIGGVIGAVDCTHVTILCPTEEGHNYMNRKGFYSKNIQLICDSNLKILNVNANFPGSVHDSFIWRMSAIQGYLRQIYKAGEANSWLLGDSGYPLQPYLLTPFTNVQPNSPEERYNKAHTSARNCIERCIKLLKTRFRCLLKERSSRYSPEFLGHIINACCTLHNICLLENIHLNGQYVNEEINIHNRNAVDLHQNDIIHAGQIARNGVVNRYFG